AELANPRPSAHTPTRYSPEIGASAPPDQTPRLVTMSPDWEVLKTATDLLVSGEPFVLITVVKTQGSTPRTAGAKMIWRPGATLNGTGPNGAHGTVGGGQFE